MAVGVAGDCPDGGTCHHLCGLACFRVLTCEPLSGVFPADRWPAEVRENHRSLDNLIDDWEIGSTAARMGPDDS